jgi:hypothetical protein
MIERKDNDTDETRRKSAWKCLDRLWRESKLDSHGERLTREQLHERHLVPDRKGNPT